MSAFTIQNRLNDPSSNNTVLLMMRHQQVHSSAYVHNKMQLHLENLSTTLDVRLTQNVRSTSDVEVYFRATSSEEVRNIDDLAWTF